ncbi:MAG: hypothetical protein U0470_05805 [Anaerolineae bacterium]
MRMMATVSATVTARLAQANSLYPRRNTSNGASSSFSIAMR